MRELKRKDKSKKVDASPLEQTLNSPLEQGGALQELNRAIGNNALSRAILDEVANRFSSRADASGRRFALSHLGDERVARPLSRMPDSDIRRIVNDIRSEPDFIPEFVPELIDAINCEIRERPSLRDITLL